MLSEFVPLEVVIEIRWSKPMPIDHGSSYRAATFSRIPCRPNVRLQSRRLMITPAAVGCKPMLDRAGSLGPGLRRVIEPPRFNPSRLGWRYLRGCRVRAVEGGTCPFSRM
jgi:hypothetical protein